MQRFDTVNHLWLPPRDSDNMPSGMVGRFVSVHRHLPEYLDKIYYADDVSRSVYEIHYDHENDGTVTWTDLGIAPSLWGYQMLVPAYYDEILL